MIAFRYRALNKRSQSYTQRFQDGAACHQCVSVKHSTVEMRTKRTQAQEITAQVSHRSASEVKPCIGRTQ